MKRIVFLCGFFLFITSDIVVAQSVKQWEVVELNFTASQPIINPYLDGLPASGERKLVVEFTGTAGDAKGKVFRINGFWDGGNKWKVRFAPPFTGAWQYASVGTGRLFKSRKGSILVTGWADDEKNQNPLRRGFIYVSKTGERAGRYFVHADGSPFLWVADTWWNWTQRRIHFSTFQKLVDDRAAKGFTIGQLFVAGNGWGQSASLLNPTYDLLDITHMQKIDSMIRYANSKGIVVWVHAWWSRAGNNITIGEEKMRRWWRYLEDRLSAYNVIWIGAGEYNLENYGGFSLEFWKSLGAMIKQEDPYHRIVSYHPTPPGWDGGDKAPQWSTAEVIHQEPWLDYNQSQVGHGKWRNERIPAVVRDAYSRTPAKPVVITEPWYEFIEGNPDAKDIRFGAWSAFLSGAAGHTYGGGHVWLAHVPESPSGGDTWPLDKSFETNTLNYPGAVSMGTMSKFLRQIPWWKLEPDTSFVKEYPEAYCSSVPGKQYLIYLRYGGLCKVDLQNSQGEFQYTWIHPLTGKPVKSGKITGGKIIALSPPGDYPGVLHYQDWVVYITLASN